MRNNKKIPVILLVLIVIALPLLLIVIKQTLDNRSGAAAPDKLETEGGTLTGNAVTRQDSGASGGSYVELGINTTNLNKHEAENFTLSPPMQIGSDTNALNGQYISPASGGESTTPTREASLSITIPSSNTYYVWARMIGPTLTSDALYVGIDSSWDRIFPSTINTYEWVRVENGINSGVNGFSLTAGTHTIQVGHGEIGARLDSVYLTTDPNEVPSFGSTGGSSTPMPTTAQNNTPTPTSTSGNSPITIQGYGAHALDGLPSNVYTVTSTAGYPSTAQGTFGGALAWINAGNKGTIKFAVSGTIDLGPSYRSISGKSNILIDGRGQNITFIGGAIWFRGGSHHYAVVNVRHRGGLGQDQSNDSFTNSEGTHDFAYINVSTSDAGDEGISSTQGSYNYTIQDSLFGPGVSGHNYGSLNYGNDADKNGPASFIRNTWIGLDYRNPKLAYRGDPENGSPDSFAPDPNPITYDVINNVTINCNYGLTAELGAKVRNVNAYTQGNAHPDLAQTGAVINNSFPVASYAQVSPMTATAAKDYAKTHSGALPHDSFDTSLLSQIN